MKRLEADVRSSRHANIKQQLNRDAGKLFCDQLNHLRKETRVSIVVYNSPRISSASNSASSSAASSTSL